MTRLFVVRVLVIAVSVLALNVLPAHAAPCPRPRPDVVCQAIGCPVLPHPHPYRRFA